MIRSLGIASDVMVMEGLSTLEQRDGYKVLRTPSEPDFWFGNFVLFDECPDDPSSQIAAFEREFPNARHRLILWDDPQMTAGAGHAVLEKGGFEIERDDVLALTGPLQRKEPPCGIEIRPVSSDADWQAVIQLQIETGLEAGHDPALHPAYVQKRFENTRRQTQGGRCGWFGAFDREHLVGDLGIMFDSRTARYRSVETRASHRRRGICQALLTAAHDWAMSRSPKARPVIVALADSDAGRIYRRCGFKQLETSFSALKRGY